MTAAAASLLIWHSLFPIAVCLFILDLLRESLDLFYFDKKKGLQKTVCI